MRTSEEIPIVCLFTKAKPRAEVSPIDYRVSSFTTLFVSSMQSGSRPRMHRPRLMASKWHQTLPLDQKKLY